MSRVTVTGEVTRVFSKGFDLTETITAKDGREFKQRYTVWTSDLPMQGDRLTVEGEQTLGVDEWTGRDNTVHHSVKASINFPKITSERAQEPRGRDETGSGYTAQGGGPWDTAEVPF